MNITIIIESLRLISFKCISHHSYIILIYHRYMQQVPPSISMPTFRICNNNFKLSAEVWQPNSNSCHSQTSAFMLTYTYTIAFIWRENMLGYLSPDIICSEKWTVFRERSSRKTVSFEEPIISKDKYPSLFSQLNWGYCVYYPSVLKIGEYPRIFPGFSWGLFAHVTRLDQSRERKYLMDYNWVYLHWNQGWWFHKVC